MDMGEDEGSCLTVRTQENFELKMSKKGKIAILKKCLVKPRFLDLDTPTLYFVTL